VNSGSVLAFQVWLPAPGDDRSPHDRANLGTDHDPVLCGQRLRRRCEHRRRLGSAAP
jgi:hypothetical protein